ncbi:MULTISPECIES: 2-oxoisovalerate dehydrogenase E1 subunit beta [unclassified Anabaena]|uniref:2-oxoisovalerate dehydrogenase E1 subunit beta n=1 Tax=unclassified Anabaena TaxID=2619674 RepID=UPI0039C5EDD0
MNNTATEIVFLIEEDPEGGYTAKALGESIFTQADDIASFKEMLRDAVRCHFPDEANRPKVIELIFNSINTIF